MKQVIMILILIGGFAVGEAGAQANCNPANCKPADCPPCPPGCCIFNGWTGKGVAMKTTDQPVDVAFAAMLAEGVKSAQEDCKMSRKEMKACIASCKAASSKTTTTSCAPTPSCHTTEAVLSTASLSPTTQRVNLQKS